MRHPGREGAVKQKLPGDWFVILYWKWRVSLHIGAGRFFCLIIGYQAEYGRYGFAACSDLLPPAERTPGRLVWRRCKILLLPEWPFSFVRLNDTPIALMVSWYGRDGWRYSKSFYFPFWRRWAR